MFDLKLEKFFHYYALVFWLFIATILILSFVFPPFYSVSYEPQGGYGTFMGQIKGD